MYYTTDNSKDCTLVSKLIDVIVIHVYIYTYDNSKTAIYLSKDSIS